MTHTYNEEGNNGGNHEPLNRSEFLKGKQGNPRTADFGNNSKGDAGTHGRPNQSEF